MTCKSPIDIITTSATPDSNGLLFNYSAGDCTSSKGSNNGIPFIKLSYTPDSKNNVMYKNTTYALTDIRLYKNSIHTIDGKFFAGELIMVHTSTDNLKIYICIPISLTTDITKSSFGTILKTIPSTVHTFQSPKTFIPPSAYYSYTGTNLYNCEMEIEYIVFSSSGLNITPAEFNGLPNNTFKQVSNTGIVIYIHSNQSSTGSGVGASPITTIGSLVSTANNATIGSLVSTANNAVSFGDDNIYIDCQSVDAPESSPPSISGAPVQSINFSNLQNNKLIQMLLMFIIFMIVMVIFFYSYEFTTGMFRELTKSVAKMNPL
jgi:carbonic anhydrase